MKKSNVKWVLGAVLAILTVSAGCGKTSTGTAVLKQAPYVIALSQPGGSVPGSLYALSPTQGTVQKLNLSVGLTPNSMLLDGSSLYVVNEGDSTISVITIAKTAAGISMTNNGYIQLPYNSDPEYLTVTTVNGMDKGYVSLNETNQIAVLNMDKNTVLEDISVPSYGAWDPSFQPHPWEISLVDGKVMLANNGGDYAAFTYTSPGMVSVIDQSSDRISGSITTTTGINLQAVAPLTTTGFVVVSVGNYGSVGGYAELFDNSGVERHAVPLSGGGAAIAISGTGTGYVALDSMVGYDTIDTNTGQWITTTDLTKQVSGLKGGWLTSIKLAPDGTLWATDWQDNMVFEIDPRTNTVMKTFTLPEAAQDVVFVY